METPICLSRARRDIVGALRCMFSRTCDTGDTGEAEGEPQGQQGTHGIDANELGGAAMTKAPSRRCVREDRSYTPPYRKLPLEGLPQALRNACHVFHKKVRASDRSFFFGDQEAMIAKPDQTEGQRWNITQEIRNQVVSRLMEIVRSDNPAQSIRAARLLMEIDQLNISAEALAVEVEADMKKQIQKVLRQRGEG